MRLRLRTTRRRVVTQGRGPRALWKRKRTKFGPWSLGLLLAVASATTASGHEPKGGGSHAEIEALHKLVAVTLSGAPSGDVALEIAAMSGLADRAADTPTPEIDYLLRHEKARSSEAPRYRLTERQQRGLRYIIERRRFSHIDGVPDLVPYALSSSVRFDWEAATAPALGLHEAPDVLSVARVLSRDRRAEVRYVAATLGKVAWLFGADKAPAVGIAREALKDRDARVTARLVERDLYDFESTDLVKYAIKRTGNSRPVPRTASGVLRGRASRLGEAIAQATRGKADQLLGHFGMSLSDLAKDGASGAIDRVMQSGALALSIPPEGWAGGASRVVRSSGTPDITLEFGSGDDRVAIVIRDFDVIVEDGRSLSTWSLKVTVGSGESEETRLEARPAFGSITRVSRISVDGGEASTNGLVVWTAVRPVGASGDFEARVRVWTRETERE